MSYTDFANATQKLHQGNNTDYINLVSTLDPQKFLVYAKKYISDNKPKQTLYYMYTFTLKPNADADKAKQYIESTKNRKEALNLVDLAYSEEHVDTNHHFHVLIGSTRKIRSDAFKQYAQSYGHIKRSRKISDTKVQILDYITKENTVKWLIRDKIVL